jgi:uncharacterized protein YaaW (UPF0174 family)
VTRWRTIHLAIARTWDTSMAARVIGVSLFMGVYFAGLLVGAFIIPGPVAPVIYLAWVIGLSYLAAWLTVPCPDET